MERHRAERPPFWKTIETAADPRIELSSLCVSYGSKDVLLIDSLGTWVADELFRGSAAQLLERGSALIAGLRTARCSSIVVSEETGWGIVPEYPSGRLFRDTLGRLNQQFARAADVSYLTVAGYALDLKNGMPIVDFAPSDLVPQAHDIPHHNH
jgi:adenosylcobinamide kinase/adenosylcobinamide-phosphate guanylyltransferase